MSTRIKLGVKQKTSKIIIFLKKHIFQKKLIVWTAKLKLKIKHTLNLNYCVEGVCQTREWWTEYGAECVLHARQTARTSRASGCRVTSKSVVGQ